ncbi:hypothetical protein NE237_014867 [Protea cynaroides]|uniref:Uncharacterized protein n=1 Tax=Protea cynaroides TaxID=273540 RepID=A0A9Q0KD52_9MAGN|nr:hypothetical protein NE237_014867 [Protea cynaroides]
MYLVLIICRAKAKRERGEREERRSNSAGLLVSSLHCPKLLLPVLPTSITSTHKYFSQSLLYSHPRKHRKNSLVVVSPPSHGTLSSKNLLQVVDSYRPFSSSKNYSLPRIQNPTALPFLRFSRPVLAFLLPARDWAFMGT